MPSVIEKLPSIEVIKKLVEEGRNEFLSQRGKPLEVEDVCDDPRVNRRLGIGVALEITVRLLAPELFEQVLAVVQGRESDAEFSAERAARLRAWDM